MKIKKQQVEHLKLYCRLNRSGLLYIDGLLTAHRTKNKRVDEETGVYCLAFAIGSAESETVSPSWT